MRAVLGYRRLLIKGRGTGVNISIQEATWLFIKVGTSLRMLKFTVTSDLEEEHKTQSNKIDTPILELVWM